MGIAIDFPTDPHVILHPAQRWFPGEEEALGVDVYAQLLPPLVDKVRKGVAKWRAKGYPKASPTSQALLNWWFNEQHLLPGPDGTDIEFQYYFAQREAVESAIWLYEVEGARDPYSLMRYDSSGKLATGHFAEDWTRYVMKLATGAGKTKVLSLLIAWSYFHARYEKDSELSRNFLLIAPNIIVLERLRDDFDALRIFRADPVVPPNGYQGRDWDAEFQMNLHIQDDIGTVSSTGNLFLTNIHRVYEGSNGPSIEDDDLTSYFIGKRPTGSTHAGQIDLTDVIRDIDDLVVLNDEAHHIWDPSSEWFKSIQNMSLRLRQKGGGLAAQFDVTATPKNDQGAIFPQTIADYPLVEAIRQNVVKTPVLPDEASRARLSERPSDDPAERYRDYLHLGYLEWKKRYDELEPTGKKAVLFVMASDTAECDLIAEHLEKSYPRLSDSILTIHTKKNGEISEAASNEEELNLLREASRKIDHPDSPYKAIVSVLMLREGWDVQNVVSMVGLRPYTSTSKILPEQTLGRGLRRMFRGDDSVTEYVSIVGTDAFMDFVEGIRSEGVELSYVEMGERTTPPSPLVIEVDTENKSKNLDKLDIEVPVLTPRIQQNYTNLDDIDVGNLPKGNLPVQQFTEEQQREIVFRDLDTDEVAWVTDLGEHIEPTPSAVVAYFTNSIIRSLRLVGGHDVLYGKVKAYIETRLFDRTVNLDNANVLRNLSEVGAVRAIKESFIGAINMLTVSDVGTAQVRNTIKLSKVRPFVTKKRPHIKPRKSIFNRVFGDSQFELDFAKFVDECEDVTSFAKLEPSVHFHIEYVKTDGSIGHYRPDFLVKQPDNTVWVVETKGLEDLDVAPKWKRLTQWCHDASGMVGGCSYRPLYVTQVAWNAKKWSSYGQLASYCLHDEPAGMQLSVGPTEDEPLDEGEVLPFETHLPLLTLEVAAGPFGSNPPIEEVDWVEVDIDRSLHRGMFVSRVIGQSMEPRIPAGSLAVFERNPEGGPLVGSRQGKIVLAQLVNTEDPEGGGSFTVKEYRSEKRESTEGEWEHGLIMLCSLNPKVDDITIIESDGLSVIAEFVAVLE